VRRSSIKNPFNQFLIIKTFKSSLKSEFFRARGKLKEIFTQWVNVPIFCARLNAFNEGAKSKKKAQNNRKIKIPLLGLPSMFNRSELYCGDLHVNNKELKCMS
jgi:hypothetical protein